MLYQHNNSAPRTLPPILHDDAGNAFTNTDAMPADRLAEFGWTVAPEKPEHDPATQRVEWQDDAWAVIDIPQPPAPEPHARSLSKIEFVELVQSAGGMDDQQLVEAWGDQQLQALWIKLNLAGGVERDHDATQAGLQGMAALGYLPGGAQAVLDAWPMN